METCPICQEFTPLCACPTFDFFAEAVAISRVHAAQYLPSRFDPELHENESDELAAEERQVRAEFYEGRDEP